METSLIDKIMKDPMFNVQCLTCAETFNIHFKYIPAKKTIACPCCGQEMRSEIYDNLRRSIGLLNEFLGEQQELNVHPHLFSTGSERTSGFVLSVEWENKLPREKEIESL